ncbi:MAG TPA: NADH-quinone oxidoreductase subunit N [Cyclobacteriaceae bacterium]|jgi:NADH-quinone oxidoreductase subunit N
MELSDFLIMRHEILLITGVLLILIVDLSIPDNKKKKIPVIASFVMGIITLFGFYPVDTGSLFGNMYVTDMVRLTMKNILNLGVFLIFLQSSQWLCNKENDKKIAEFYLLILSSLIGVNYLISSGHFIMFYLGLELTTIPIAALASFHQYQSKSAEAGIKLILSSAFSSAILLFGISILYASLGSLYFNQMHLGSDIINVMGFIFFFSGIAFKISIVPFHLWTADVYEGSPTSVTAYLSVVSKGSAIFILLLTLGWIFRPLSQVSQDILYAVAIITMTIGNLFAIRQQNIKRFLAFSSIAQAGFILLGLVGGTSLGITSVIYFILIYVFSNLGAFGVVIAVEQSSGKVNINDYDGLYRTNPRLSLVMMLALFSLAGIPPVAGFFGKFFLFTAAAESGFYTLLLIAVLNAIISLYYYLLVVKAMFINKSDSPVAGFKSDFSTRLSLMICVVGIIVTGFYSPIFEFIKELSLGI